MTSVILRRRKLGLTSCREIASKMSSVATVVRNDKPIPVTDLVFRWGCTSDLPVDTKVINKAEAIHLVNDKAKFRMLLQEKMPEYVPHTYIVPLNEIVTLPTAGKWVARPYKHAQGRKLKCGTPDECYAALLQWGMGGYISEYIPKVAEYRVAIVQGRVVWVAKKTPADPNAVAWNVAQGGSFENVNWSEWPLRAVRVSVEAFSHSGLDFGAVDVMVDAEGKVYVLEINSAPSQTSPYRQECFAKAFDYIVANGRQSIPLIVAKGGYKKFIHPAVCADALLVNN